jgi:ribosomal peptide maturation radical SAM protein 1
MTQNSKNSILLVSMPFAISSIPSIQLALFESYLSERGINVKTKHLYLKAAEIYGINKYNFLVLPPNDSYTAQIVFSKYVFPDHWEKNKENIKKYFDSRAILKPEIHKNFKFEDYVEKTDNIYTWFFKNVEWQDYDIIGFTLNYGQFLPSLAISKKIKELNPKKKIIFGGSRTIGEIGKNVLKNFSYIDFIASGEGEELLFLLASDRNNYESIPNLIYRKDDEIIWNDSNEYIELNNLSIPSYNSFFNEMSLVSNEIQQFFQTYGRLPVEISRGCWWNKCTFCNLNFQHKKYREKSIDKIVNEIQFLSDSYKVLSFQLIGNILPKKNCRELFKKIKELGKDLTFYAETRADQFKSIDYKMLKEAGFTNIQTGIESFSKSYLEKMNKGTKVIDNIATLKFCKENGIRNEYNLIISYPNEDIIDYEETNNTIQQIKYHLDPPNICYLRVLFGSPIQIEPKKFGIDNFFPPYIDYLMFPKEILKNQINFIYEFKRKNDGNDRIDWVKLLENWKKTRDNLDILSIKSKQDVDKFIFYFIDGKNFLKIYDKRDTENLKIYVLNELERDIFLSCVDVINKKELINKFSEIDQSQLDEILNDFVSSGVVFREEEYYLSLPLSYKNCQGIIRNNSHKTNNIESFEENILI